MKESFFHLAEFIGLLNLEKYLPEGDNATN
jgi:hypothetical protein